MPKLINDEHILQAVIETITEFGYSGTTTRQIAESVGINEVTLFRKFTNKATMVKSAIEALIKNIDFESVAQYTGEIRSDLIKVIEAYQATVVTHSRFFLILINEMKLHPELAGLMDVPTELLYSIANLLKQYQSDGILRREHPLHAAASLLGPLIYSEMINSTIANNKIPEFDIGNFIDCYLDGRMNKNRSEKM
jgi:AcrR family transcriptional regulator